VRPDDEGQLIKQAKSHDPGAISELYNRHVDQIFHYVFNRTGEVPLAEDLTGDVFLRALESLAAYDDHGVPFIAWLYRIAQARVIDHWRRTHHRTTVSFEDQDLPGWLATDDIAENDVLQHERLASSLVYLTEEQQQVIVLKFMQGLNNAEIAQIMGKTEGAVKALQRRGLEALARLLKI
jgi:RNA polymerase sigma-70 factor (ECF subfamily)